MICDSCIHKEVCYEKEEDRRALKHCSDYFNFTEELEKIKADLEYYSRYTARNDLVDDWENIEEVFNEHISELKGEQK